MLGAFMRTEILCISVLRVASGPRVKLASCKSTLNPTVVYSTDVLKQWSRCWSHSLLFCGSFYKAICFKSCLVLFCSWFICCYFFFSPFSIAITSLGEERELILVLFVRLFDLRLFGFVCFLFLLVFGKGCDLWLWHSLDFSLTYFARLSRPAKASATKWPPAAV